MRKTNRGGQDVGGKLQEDSRGRRVERECVRLMRDNDCGVILDLRLYR
jgi:hypothetical protein